jgi:type II secretory pathway pseudopilin PulG
MKFRLISLLVFCFLTVGLTQVAVGQRSSGQTELSLTQRLEVLNSKLDLMRRSLSSAVSSMTPAAKSDDKTKPNADDPVTRLKGLEKEVASTSTEVNDIRTKNDRAEKFDTSAVDRLETSVTELNTRVELALQQTASARGTATSAAATTHKKKKGKLFGLLGGGGDEDKYAELTGAAVAGRDRVLFEEGAKEVR